MGPAPCAPDSFLGGKKMNGINKIIKTSGGLMLTQKAVEDLISRSNSSFTTKDSETNVLEVLDTQAELLQSLLNQALVVEQNFYNELNINIDAKNYKAALQELQARLDEISLTSGLNELIDNPYAIMSKFEQYFISLDSDTILEVINDPDNLAALASNIPDQPEIIDSVDKLIDALNMNLIIGDKKTIAFHKQQKGQNVNLMKKLKFSLEKGKFELETDMTLDAKTRDKILQAVRNAKNPENKQKAISGTLSQDQLQQWFKLIEQDLKSRLKTEKAKRFLEAEFKKNIYNGKASKYFLNRNVAVFKGFLAELHNNLVLDLLFNKVGAVKPTGNLKLVLKNGAMGGSIPVDAVLRAYKFQVKGYTLSEDSELSFRDEHGAGYFINQRADITGDLAEILTELFASYQFNQHFPEHLRSEDDDFDTTYSKFGSTLADSQKVFQAYISNIIGLTSVFKSQRYSPFGKEQMYVNTFFNIKGKFIPASAILNSILYSLKISRASEAIRFNIDAIKKDDNTAYTLGRLIEEETGYMIKNWRKGVDYTARDIADRVKIKWSVQLNLRRILERAYKDLDL